MMMILGMFPFSLQTTPYQSANKTNSWRHVKNDRVGNPRAISSSAQMKNRSYSAARCTPK